MRKRAMGKRNGRRPPAHRGRRVMARRKHARRLRHAHRRRDQAMSSQ
jgi:hypothetical protein